VHSSLTVLKTIQFCTMSASSEDLNVSICLGRRLRIESASGCIQIDAAKIVGIVRRGCTEVKPPLTIFI